MHPNKPPILIRPASEADLPVLRAIYADSVQALAPPLYNPEQVQVWSAFAREPGFADFILTVTTWVAEDAETGMAVGFCGIGDDGHVASIYVAPDHGRHGIGSRLLKQALDHCPRPNSGRWFAEASRLSRPLLERHGFRVIGTEQSEREGILFTRERMERHP